MSIKLTQAERTLIDSVLINDLPAARTLLDSGVSVGVRDSEHEETPLMLARSEQMTKILLERGTDVNAQDEHGWTALVYTKYPILLLEAGADPNIRNKDGETPLMIAVSRADFNKVEALITHGADVNAVDHNGFTALSTARSMALLYLVDMLKSAGAVE